MNIHKRAVLATVQLSGTRLIHLVTLAWIAEIYTIHWWHQEENTAITDAMLYNRCSIYWNYAYWIETRSPTVQNDFQLWKLQKCASHLKYVKDTKILGQWSSLPNQQHTFEHQHSHGRSNALNLSFSITLITGWLNTLRIQHSLVLVNNLTFCSMKGDWQCSYLKLLTYSDHKKINATNISNIFVSHEQLSQLYTTHSLIQWNLHLKFCHCKDNINCALQILQWLTVSIFKKYIQVTSEMLQMIWESNI